MPPLALSPAIAAVLSVVGAVALGRFIAKEWRRINDELDATPTATAEAIDRSRLPTLRRDPRTGVYRPE